MFSDLVKHAFLKNIHIFNLNFLNFVCNFILQNERVKSLKKIKTCWTGSENFDFWGEGGEGGEVVLCCKFYSGLGIWGDCTLKYFLNEPH